VLDLWLDLDTAHPCLTNACVFDLHAHNENVSASALSWFDAAISAPQVTAGDLLATSTCLDHNLMSNRTKSLDIIVFQMADYHRQSDHQQR
jgi:hypothetical protein